MTAAGTTLQVTVDKRRVKQVVVYVMVAGTTPASNGGQAGGLLETAVHRQAGGVCPATTGGGGV